MIKHYRPYSGNRTRGSRLLLAGCTAASLFLSGSLLAQDTKDPDAATETTQGKYDAIVRIENSSLVPDYTAPWNTGNDSGGSGTGFLIGDNRFLTNAHVVSDSQLIYVKKKNDPKPYRANIIAIAHDCDLAMLELDDFSAFENVTALEIGGLPQLDTVVKTIGYPIGGERISVTSGVVSRIDFNSYSHSNADMHLTIQIDAAINPGNSGGPVLQEGKVVGVAFQGYSGSVAQSTGYMIPTPVIERFLKDVGDDGKYDHYVDLAVSDFNLLNPAQRKALGLPNDGIGIMVANADAEGSAGGVLQMGDVLLAVDGYPIASNGLVTIHGESIDMNEVVERKFAGDKVMLKVWRDKKAFEAEIELKRYLPYLITANNYDVKPRYVAFAGLVFQPLDRNLMGAYGMEDPQVRYFYNYYTIDQLYKDHPEIIILTNILPDSINTHFAGFEQSIVEEIDGKPIKTLQDSYDAFQNIKPDQKFVVIKFIGNGRPIVIETSRVKSANNRIREKYNVLRDHYLGEEPKANEDDKAKEEEKDDAPGSI
jgi:S1-C subfamily serine protease